MNEQPSGSKPTDVIKLEKNPVLDGEIGRLGENLTFQTDQREPSSNLPSITSVWTPELIRKAQEVADRRDVSLDIIVMEWEYVWSANG